MQINNVTPAPPKTLADLSVGDCFVSTKFPEKILILFSKISEESVGFYGVVELGSNGISVHNPFPANPFSAQDVVSVVEIHSIDFSEKK
jgi:hypothetical protein